MSPLSSSIFSLVLWSMLVLLWQCFVLYSNTIWAFLAPESSLLPLHYGDTAVCVVGSGLAWGTDFAEYPG